MVIDKSGVCLATCGYNIAKKLRSAVYVQLSYGETNLLPSFSPPQSPEVQHERHSHLKRCFATQLPNAGRVDGPSLTPVYRGNG